jgi:hypothetical protein
MRKVGRRLMRMKGFQGRIEDVIYGFDKRSSDCSSSHTFWLLRWVLRVVRQLSLSGSGFVRGRIKRGDAGFGILTSQDVFRDFIASRFLSFKVFG